MYRLQSLIKGRRDRNSRQEVREKPRRKAAYWLASSVSSPASYITITQGHFPSVALPTVGSVLLHQLAGRKMPYRQANVIEAVSQLRVPHPRCAKLAIKNSMCTCARTHTPVKIHTQVYTPKRSAYLNDYIMPLSFVGLLKFRSCSYSLVYISLSKISFPGTYRSQLDMVTLACDPSPRDTEEHPLF